MAETKGKLYLAFKKEKDPKMRSRMLAVPTWCATAAWGWRKPRKILCSLPTGYACGLDAMIRGALTPSGIFPKAAGPEASRARRWISWVGEAVRSRCTPEKLQRHIHDETGTKLHITYVRKIMRARRLTPKEPQKVHINRAGKKAVQGWQYRFRKLVPRLEGEGFTILDEDEAFFVHDTVSGRKY